LTEESIPPSVMEAIDKLYWSPNERASGVNALLREMLEHIRKHNKAKGLEENKNVPSEWDIFCFACEFAGVQAVTIGDDDLLDTVITLNRWLYSAHYSNPGRLYGEPDKTEGEDEDNGEV
jgi:hypothetical protein